MRSVSYETQRPRRPPALVKDSGGVERAAWLPNLMYSAILATYLTGSMRTCV